MLVCHEFSCCKYYFSVPLLIHKFHDLPNINIFYVTQKEVSKNLDRGLTIKGLMLSHMDSILTESPWSTMDI